MAGTYLVRRPTSSDKFRVPSQIGAILVAASTVAEALSRAKEVLFKTFGPNVDDDLSGWTADLIGAANLASTWDGTVFQGPCIIPGDKLNGGGIAVSAPFTAAS